jgi:hypothetical protein
MISINFPYTYWDTVFPTIYLDCCDKDKELIISILKLFDITAYNTECRKSTKEWREESKRKSHLILRRIPEPEEIKEWVENFYNNHYYREQRII